MVITILGFTAAFFTTFSTLPQAIKTLKTKKTKDIALPMYIMLGVGVVLWVAYGVFIKDAPLVVANCITFCLVIPIILLKVKHG